MTPTKSTSNDKDNRRDESQGIDDGNDDDDDVIRNTIGDFGKWQLKISVLMALLKFPIAWFQIGSVLLAPPTKFHCRKPDSLANYSNVEWESFYDPTRNPNVSAAHRSVQSNRCLMPNVSSALNGYGSNETAAAFDNVRCVDGFVYDTSVFQSTIISEWNLVCDDEYLVELSQIVLMFGVLVGNIVFGVAADRYGRKSSLMVSIAVQAAAGVMTAAVPWYWGFAFFRFVVGVANGGTAITSFVLCMEIVGGKYRTVVPILYQIPFGVATSTMAALSYWLSDWRHLQLTLSALSALGLAYGWLITESPRWLIAVGATSECESVVARAAAANRSDVARVDRYFKRLERRARQQRLESAGAETEARARLSDLCRSPRLARRTALLYSNWFFSGISFFAFSLHVGHIGANGPAEDGAAGAGVRTAVACAGLGAIPGALLCAWVARASGRKKTVLIANVAAAICLLALAATKPAGAPTWLKLTLIVLNVIAMAVYTPALYVYTGELFPTVVRNAGVGVAAMFSRIGSMLAPLLLTSANISSAGDSANVSPVLITLSALALVQALLVIPLPETRGRPLPDTIDDVDKSSSSNNNNNVYSTVPTTSHHRVSHSEEIH